MRNRIEKDILGEKELSAESYYGIGTLRGKENFQITKRGISRQMIKGLAIVKKAAAKANNDIGVLTDEQAKVIMLSCDEILNGRLHGQFVTDLIQGGAGSAMNMNANEVIGNRANEMMGGTRGGAEYVDPLKHVNYGQSTYDVIPTAGKIAAIRHTKKLLVELKKLQNSLSIKANEFSGIKRPGQNYISTDLGQEFTSFIRLLTRDMDRIEQAMTSLLEINIGATLEHANDSNNTKYIRKVVLYISKYTGEDFKSPKSTVDATRHLDTFLFLSTCIKILAIDLAKIANDIRALANTTIRQGGLIKIPAVQPGSSVNPEIIDPVIPEMINQVSFFVIGSDATITRAVEASEFEQNGYEPVILFTLFDTITYVRRATRTFRELTIDGLIANI